jgi:hypothetical protein
MFPYIKFSKPKYETDAEYFKTELFPKDKDYEDLGIDIEEVHLPKNKNSLRTDLSLLNTHLTIIDSAVKKLAKFILDKNFQNDYIYKSCLTTNEELLDYDQYVEGFKKMGIYSKKYLNEEELNTLFINMDENHSKILTFDEYKQFLEKIDIYSIKSNLVNESQKRIRENLFDLDIEQFINSTEEEKKQRLASILDKVKNFYMNIPDVTFDDIRENMNLINKKITKEENKIKSIEKIKKLCAEFNYDFKDNNNLEFYSEEIA